MAPGANSRRDAPEVAFTLNRVFNAPRDLIWKCWTEKERLAEWWGPKGMALKVVKLDLRPGGIFLYSMTTPTGQEMFGRFVYREIQAPERMSHVVSFCDAQGQAIRHPGAPTWPIECLSIATFTEKAGKTTIAMQFYPLNASDEEIATFKAGHDGMKQGFGGTYDQLDVYLAKKAVAKA
ncbi:MAG TPA: SRPBCC domain-containing protein [Planctomycetota bacterium]|nr:SRPBCC domain-containing protein [Planctomycetota bacterium]